MLYVLAGSSLIKQLENKPFKTIIPKTKIEFEGKDIVFFGIEDNVNRLNIFDRPIVKTEERYNDLQVGGKV